MKHYYNTRRVKANAPEEAISELKEQQSMLEAVQNAFEQTYQDLEEIVAYDSMRGIDSNYAAFVDSVNKSLSILTNTIKKLDSLQPSQYHIRSYQGRKTASRRLMKYLGKGARKSNSTMTYDEDGNVLIKDGFSTYTMDDRGYVYDQHDDTWYYLKGHEWWGYGQSHDVSYGQVDEFNPLPSNSPMIDTLDKAWEMRNKPH